MHKKKKKGTKKLQTTDAIMLIWVWITIETVKASKHLGQP